MTRTRLVAKGWIVATLLCAAALYFASWWQVRDLVADDTYIHLTYAKHVRDGQGLVFNVGERVYGSTSPLWSMGLGYLGRTGIDLLLLCKILSVAFGLATVLLGALALHRFLRAWSDGAVDPRVTALAWTLGTLALAADVWLVRWSASGMESSLGTLLVLGGFVAAFGRSPPGRWTAEAAWWWTLASLIRPEASLLIGLLAVRCLVEPGPRAVRLRMLARALWPPALLGGAWLAYAAWFYGTVIPITLASKAAVNTPALENLLLQARELAADRGIEIVAILVALPLLAPRLRREWRQHLVPLGWLVALPLFYVVSRVPGITRYLMVLAPLLVCYGWGAIALAADRIARRGRAGLARATVLLAGVAALGANEFVFSRHVVPQARAFERILERSLIPLAKWFDAHTPPDTRVAIPHVGVLGYYSNRRVVDMGGLVTPGIGPLLSRYRYEGMVCEFRFASRVRPDYLIDVDPEPRHLLTCSPYASCLTLVEQRPFDYRSIQHPERAFATVYRIDWGCYDSRPPAPDDADSNPPAPPAGRGH